MLFSVVLFLAVILGAEAMVAWALFRGRGPASGRPLAPWVGLQVVLVSVALAAGNLTYELIQARNKQEIVHPAALRTAFPVPRGDAAWVSASSRLPGRVPAPLNDLQEFRAWQAALRLRVSSALLQLPESLLTGSRGSQITGEVAVEQGITRRAFLVRARDGVDIPGFIFLPSGVGQRPAVLVVPGHPTRDSESGLAETAGLVDSYQHAAALAFARAGMVAATLELRGFGLLGPPGFPDHRSVAHNAIASGTSYKALVATDIGVVLDLVTAQPEVDADRVGIAGASLGGELALLVAATDTRFKVVAVNSFVPPPGPAVSASGTTLREQPHYCHTIPGESAVLLQEDWFYLIAPRPLFVAYGVSDARHATPAVTDALLAPYRAFGLTTAVTFAAEGRGHEFFVDKTAAFLSQHLR